VNPGGTGLNLLGTSISFSCFHFSQKWIFLCFISLNGIETSNLMAFFTSGTCALVFGGSRKAKHKINPKVRINLVFMVNVVKRVKG